VPPSSRRAAGGVFTGVVHISEMQSLLARIYALDPDIIGLTLKTPAATCWNKCSRSAARAAAIAMFVDQSDAPRSRPRSSPRVGLYRRRPQEGADQAILDLCVSRFNAFAKALARSITLRSLERAGAVEFVLPVFAKRIEARDTEVEDGLDPLLLEAVDDMATRRPRRGLDRAASL